MGKTYNVVSKATKLNKLTGGEELPQETFYGPYMIYDRRTRQRQLLRCPCQCRELLPGCRGM